jgi:hypothetical protein
MILSESRQTFFVGRRIRIGMRQKQNGAGNSRAVRQPLTNGSRD